MSLEDPRVENFRADVAPSQRRRLYPFILDTREQQLVARLADALREWIGGASDVHTPRMIDPTNHGEVPALER